MTNVARHACATIAQLRVRLDRTVVLDVRDDGCGGAVPEAASRLRSLTDRVAIAGRKLLIHSPIGGPTRIHAEALSSDRI